MKLNLIQYIAVWFTFGWVIGQVFKCDYQCCLFLASLGAFTAAFLENAHGLILKRLNSLFKRT